MEELRSKRIPSAVETLVQSFRDAAQHNYSLSLAYGKEANSKPDGIERNFFLQMMAASSRDMDSYNNCAVSLLLQHNMYTENGKEIIDLHGLRAEEVASCLDIFLDKQIEQLRETVRDDDSPKKLHVITGKGNRNITGVPVVKNRAKNHVTEKRNLCTYEVFWNSGCSIVEIDSKSPLSSELEVRSRFREQMKQLLCTKR